MLKEYDTIVAISIKDRKSIFALAKVMNISVSPTFISKRCGFPSVVFVNGMIQGACGFESKPHGGVKGGMYNIMSARRFKRRMKNKSYLFGW